MPLKMPFLGDIKHEKQKQLIKHNDRSTHKKLRNTNKTNIKWSAKKHICPKKQGGQLSFHAPFPALFVPGPRKENKSCSGLERHRGPIDSIWHIKIKIIGYVFLRLFRVFLLLSVLTHVFGFALLLLSFVAKSNRKVQNGMPWLALCKLNCFSPL